MVRSLLRPFARHCVFYVSVCCVQLRMIVLLTNDTICAGSLSPASFAQTTDAQTLMVMFRETGTHTLVQMLSSICD